jgi:hypothetical protein
MNISYITKLKMMKKISAKVFLYCRSFAFLLIITTLFAACSLNTSTEQLFSGGTGTKADPYLISTDEDLFQLAKQINFSNDYSKAASAYYIQMDDIDLQNREWTPIGCFYGQQMEERYFSGHYNGGGHKISNLIIDSDYRQNWDEKTGDYIGDVNNIQSFSQGVFGYVKGSNSGDAVIENIVLSDCKVKYTTGGEYPLPVGTLVGVLGSSDNSNAYMKNCTMSAITIISNADPIGGAVGMNFGNIKNCFVECKIFFPSGNDFSENDYTIGYVGGFVGINCGSIKDSNVLIETSFPPQEDFANSILYFGGFGGFAGKNVSKDSSDRKNENVIISNCSVNGKIDTDTINLSEYLNIGLFVCDNMGIIKNCESSLTSLRDDVDFSNDIKFIASDIE